MKLLDLILEHLPAIGAFIASMVCLWRQRKAHRAHLRNETRIQALETKR